MAAYQEDIREWLNNAKEIDGARYLLVACDTYDYEDYPIIFENIEELKNRFQNPHSMEKFMECYDLKLDLESQLKDYRCWNPSQDELWSK
jgi:hypothetical protein